MSGTTVNAGIDFEVMERFFTALSRDRMSARERLPGTLSEIQKRYGAVLAECRWLEKVDRSEKVTASFLTRRPRRTGYVRLPDFPNRGHESEIVQYQAAHETLNTLIGLAADLEQLRMDLLEARYWQANADGTYRWIANRSIADFTNERLASIRRWAGALLPGHSAPTPSI